MTKLDLAIQKVKEKAAGEYLVVPVVVAGQEKFCVARRVDDEVFDTVKEANDRRADALISQFTMAVWGDELPL